MNQPSSVEKQDNIIIENQIPIIIFDFEGKVLEVNDLFTKEFGYSSSQFRLFDDVDKVLSLQETLIGFQQLLKIASQSGIINTSIITAENSKKDIRISFINGHDRLYTFFYTHNNKLSEIISQESEIDILRQKIRYQDQQISLLTESEKYYRQIAEAANVVIVRFDKNFKLTDFGGSAEKVFGFKKKTILGKSLFDTIVPKFESSGRDLTEMMDGILCDIRLFKYNINENITNKGKRIWMQWYNSEIKDESGELIDILSIGIDITDKIEAYDALRESEDRFRTLSDLTFEGIIIHDHGKILDINLSLEKQVGYSRKELVGKNLTDILIPEEYKEEMVSNFIKKTSSYESAARHKNGTTIPIAIESRLIPHNDKNLRVAAVRDISVLKKTINELKSSEEQLSVIFNSAPVIMMLVNENREILRVNELGKDSLQKSGHLNKKIKLRCEGHFSGINCCIDNKTANDCILDKVIDETFRYGKNLYKVEGSMLLKNGKANEKRYYQVSSTIIELISPRTILVTMDDITERKIMLSKLNQHQHQLEELVAERTLEIEKQSKELAEQNIALEFERNQLRTLIDNLPDAIYIKDKHSRFVNSNSQHINMLRAKKLEDIIGKTDFDFYPKEMAQSYFDDEQNIINTGKPIIEKEEPGFDKNKKNIIVLTTKVPLTGMDGKNDYLVGIGRDITEKKNFENKLKEHASNLKKINKLLEARTQKIEQLNNELQTSNNKLAFANGELIEQKEELLTTLEKLKLTQVQLVQSEKMASLGILSSGIAHEINNPVNFVYAGVNSVMKDMEDVIPVINEVKLISSNTNDLIGAVQKIEKLRQDYQFDEAFDAIEMTLHDIKLGATRIIEIVAGLSRFARASKDEWQSANLHEEIESILILIK